MMIWMATILRVVLMDWLGCGDDGRTVMVMMLMVIINGDDDGDDADGGDGGDGGDCGFSP